MAEVKNPEEKLVKQAEEMRNQIETMVQEEAAIEKNFEEEIQNLQEKVLPEIKDVLKENQEEEQGLESIQDDIQRIEGDLKEMVNYLNRNLSDPDDKEAVIKAVRDMEGGIGDMKDIIGGIEDDIGVEEEEVVDGLRQSVKDVQELRLVMEEMMQLRNQLKRLENEEEGLMRIAQDKGFTELERIVEGEQDQFQQAEQLSNQIQQDIETIEEFLQEIDNLIQDEIGLEEQEIKELKQLVSEEEGIIKQLNKIETIVQDEFGDGSKLANKLLQQVEGMKENMRAVERHLEQVYEVKQAEEKKEAQTENIIENFFGG